MLTDLPVVPFDSTECDGDPSNPTVTWQQYYGLRNTILRALRPFGTIGPVGECRLTEDDAVLMPDDGCLDADFFVLYDWWNEYSFYILVETQPTMISEEVLTALHQVLLAMPPHWAIGIAMDNGYILLFADKVMVKDPLFAVGRVTTVNDILHRCAMGCVYIQANNN